MDLLLHKVQTRLSRETLQKLPGTMGSLEFLHPERVIDFLIFGAVNKMYFSRIKSVFKIL